MPYAKPPFRPGKVALAEAATNSTVAVAASPVRNPVALLDQWVETSADVDTVALFFASRRSVSQCHGGCATASRRRARRGRAGRPQRRADGGHDTDPAGPAGL